VITETAEDTPEQPNQSYRNMLRLGFQVAELGPFYVSLAADGGSENGRSAS